MTKTELNSFVSLYNNWEGKKGVQRVLIHTLNEIGANLSADYKLTLQNEKGQTTFNNNITMLYNPDRVVIGENKEQTLSIFIRKGAPLVKTIDFDTDEGKAFWLALIMHPMVRAKGEKELNKKSTLSFEAEVPAETATKNVKLIKEKNAFSITLFSYPEKDLQNLAFYLKKSPFSAPNIYMNREELLSALIGVDYQGWAMTDLENYKKFHTSSDTKERAALVLLQKGMAYGFITIKSGLYEFDGSDTIGSSESESVQFILSEDNVYLRLSQKVAYIENRMDGEPLSKDDILSKLKELNITDEKLISKVRERKEKGMTAAAISKELKENPIAVSQIYKELRNEGS